MAYMNQDRKALLAPAIRAVCARYCVGATISVRNHSTLVITVNHGPIDFMASQRRVEDARPGPTAAVVTPATRTHLNINPYHFGSHFDGVALAFLTELHAAANVGNHDRSDIQTDYFDVGWYVDVNVGRWDRPYKLT